MTPAAFMKFIPLHLISIALAGGFFPVIAQEKNPKEDKHPHLVGHEDERLLERIEDALAEWDPRNLTSPYVKEVWTESGKKHVLRRPDLDEFIADPDAALALGKAFFWDMQAGSDFKKIGETKAYLGTACASCHYRFGADARNKNTATIAFQSWKQFATQRDLPSLPKNPPFDQRSEEYDPLTDGTVEKKSWDKHQLKQSHQIVGSQGVAISLFKSVEQPTCGVAAPETSEEVAKVEDGMARRRFDMFQSGGQRTRQITRRNSPSVINAVFNDRQFHDGRAESTFNGFSVFGDFDHQVILKKAVLDKKTGAVTEFLPVSIAIPNASLASQAVGPIVNEVEMSYLGRSFHDLAIKLLAAKPLAVQEVAPDDSLLSPFIDRVGSDGKGNYRDLIKKAFRREWWADDKNIQPPATHSNFHPLRDQPLEEIPEGDRLMVNNFSLYWGLSIMLYESILVSNESPFDQMLRGDEKGVTEVWEGKFGQTITERIIANADGSVTPNAADDDTVRKVELDRLPQMAHPPTLTPTAMFQRGLRVFVRNCAECHEAPTFTTAGEIDLAPDIPLPIGKLHSHALVRTALADAFKDRLIAEGFPPPAGVTNHNRQILGARRFFPDDQRFAELEALGGPLMIESMGVPPSAPAPLFGDNGVRKPMLTWLGTRPPLGFAPTLGEKTVDPYAFYDGSYYNIGVSEPRYDWGVWAFARMIPRIDEVVDGTAEPLRAKLMTTPLTASDLEKIRPDSLAPGLEGLDNAQLAALLNSIANKPNALINADDDGIGDLGSAYVLRGSEAPPAQQMRAMQVEINDPNQTKRDNSADRTYLPGAPDTRAERHLFKRARRMVMSEETWGHRKHFITDNELMGWGAFKTPSLRNVALTEPYMHNGRFLTLRQVLDFYSSDNRSLIPAHRSLNPDLHPEIGRIDLNPDGRDNLPDGTATGPVNLAQVHDAEALLFFLHCLTDQRVRREQGPFDHPSLVIVNGYDGTSAKENMIHLGKVGSAGHPEGTIPPQFPSGSDFPRIE